MKTSTLLTEREQKRIWAFRNRGILTRIAKSLDPPVTQSAVSSVLYYGTPSTNCRIERALAEAGAPFMEEHLADMLTSRQFRA